MIRQGDVCRIEHLQKEIPDEVMGLFNFIEEKDTMSMLGENLSQTPAVAGFIAHEELYVVEVEELGHVEAEKRFTTKEVSRTF